MKKILLCLAFLAIHASANSCTKAWFEINAYNYFASNNRPYLDSTHQNELTYEIDEKYIYKNGVIDTIFKYHQKATTPGYIYAFNWEKGTLTLLHNGASAKISRETVNDTLIITQTETNQEIIKILDNYAERTFIKPSTGKVSVEKTFFSNDTLVVQTSSTYKSGETNTYKSITVIDPQDDSKCTEYDDEGEIRAQLEFTKNDKGYSIMYNMVQVTSPNYKEYFMIVPEEYTTAIRKQRPAPKISPKATYFDLLGRYKFSKYHFNHFNK